VPIVVTLDVPSRTRIYKLIVKRVTGVAGAFRVTLYNNLVAAQEAASTPAGSGGNLDAAGNVIPPDNFKVTDQFTGAAGLLEYYADRDTGGFGFPFFNLDPPDANKVQNKRKLYAVLVSDVAAVYAFSVGCDSAEIG
jgi:hypothetical protein